MRHKDIGLSIPDFPLAYGSWLPDTSAAMERINAERVADSEMKTNAVGDLDSDGPSLWLC